MTREEWIYNLLLIQQNQVANKKAIPEIVKYLKQQEPCDAISRERVLGMAITHMYNTKQAYFTLSMDDVIKNWDDMIDFIEHLPPVHPTEKVGEWIIVDDCEKFIAKCSVCGCIEDSRMVHKYPYCHCGAKMKDGE